MNRWERLGAGAVALSTLMIPSDSLNFVSAEREIDASEHKMIVDNTFWKLAAVTRPSDPEPTVLFPDISSYLTLAGPCIAKEDSDKTIVLALEADSPASVLERLNAWVNKCGFRSPESDSFWVVIDTITSPENPDQSVRALRIWAFRNITGAEYLMHPPK